MTTLGAAIGKVGRDAMRAAAQREVRMRYAPITFKVEEENEDGRLFFEGMANTINPDRVKEIVKPSAFRKSLKNFLKFNPATFYNHDWSLSVGGITDAKITDKGLWVRGYVQPAQDDEGRELFGELGEFIRFVRGQVKRGQIRTLSIGFRLLDSKPVKFKDPMTGKEVDGREVTNLELLEISLVTVPANRESAIQVRSAMAAVYGEEIAESMVHVDDEGEPEYLAAEMGETSESIPGQLAALGLDSDTVADVCARIVAGTKQPPKETDTDDESSPESDGKAADTDEYEVTSLDFGDDGEYEVVSLFGGNDDG